MAASSCSCPLEAERDFSANCFNASNPSAAPAVASIWFNAADPFSIFLLNSSRTESRCWKELKKDCSPETACSVFALSVIVMPSDMGYIPVMREPWLQAIWLISVMLIILAVLIFAALMGDFASRVILVALFGPLLFSAGFILI